VQIAVRVALFAALMVSMAVPATARQAQRWYDAYEQGVQAVKRGDWTAAERLLAQAKSTGPKPARRAFTYGDNYIAFFPDYWLGVVYLRSNRSAQAESSFALVRSQEVIAAKDPEYAAFERQSREATFNRAFAQAQQFAAAGNFDAVKKPLAEALATNIDNAKVQMFSKETETQRLAKASPPPITTPDSGVKAPVRSDQTAVQTSPPMTANQAPPYQPPGSATSTARPPSPGVTPRKPDNSTVTNKGVIIPPQVTPPALRNGVLAFFSGDYGSAVQLLQTAAERPGVSPRAQMLLACAKVGLVLSGGGDAAMLVQTHAEFQSAALGRYLTPADRRYISPRILQQLERR
jgi:hypothetical protein